MASISPSVRAVSRESISSTNITEGERQRATAKRARTIFSPSPIHFEVSEEALMLKNVAPDCEAMHFPISVFPVPGGPNRRMPFGGPRSPVNMSLLVICKQVRSQHRPHHNFLDGFLSMLQAGNIVPCHRLSNIHDLIKKVDQCTSFMINCTILGSMFFRRSSDKAATS